VGQIIDEMDQVAEGVKSCAIVHEMATRLGVNAPIVESVYRVCHEGSSATEAYTGLLATAAGAELEPD
jgi:glycerol-3-phosphate dehydrogenase (NAD(P)+)